MGQARDFSVPLPRANHVEAQECFVWSQTLKNSSLLLGSGKVLVSKLVRCLLPVK